MPVSCVNQVFYMIIKLYLVWLHLCSKQFQDLFISATDLTVREILLLRQFSENVYLFG